MWIPLALIGHELHSKDRKKCPELFPTDVLSALNEMEQDPHRNRHDREFRFEGWIIRSGIVGVRPDAPKAAKEEWMDYWMARTTTLALISDYIYLPTFPLCFVNVPRAFLRTRL